MYNIYRDATPVVWNYISIDTIHHSIQIISTTMINFRSAKRFCSEDISKIENFEQAATDTNEVWDCHHRLEETTPKRVLEENGLYFNRPASELVFLTHKDHTKLHTTFHYWRSGMRGKQQSEETREKISQTRKERIASGEIVIDTSACHTLEANAKISAKAKERYKDKENHPMYGSHMSDSTKEKISAASLGKTLTEEHKQKISEGVKTAMTDEVKAKISLAMQGNTYVKGKHWKCKPRTKPAWNKGKKMSEEQKEKLRKPKSEDQKQKMRESRLGCKWYNNGVENRLFKPDKVPSDEWHLGQVKLD